MPTTTLTATFDGIAPVTALNGGTREFFDGFLGYYSVYEGTSGQDFTANVTLTGTDWTVASMRFGNADRTNLTVIDDTSSGDVRINSLELGFNSDVTLTEARARYIVGYDGDRHVVRLGNEGTNSLDLYADVNFVRTGAGYVHNIQTDGTGNIVIGQGGAGQIDMGTGKDKLVTEGYVHFIRTNDGNDKVRIGDEGAGTVNTGNGNDRVDTGSGFVDLIKTGDGNDFVTVGSGAALQVRLGNGDDTIKLQALDSGTGGVSVFGNSGRDKIDFTLITTVGVRFSLDESGAFQNIGEMEDDQPPAIGYFAEIGIEDLVGTRNADHFTGGSEDNQLIGNLGDDTLLGGDGVDRLYGNTGADFLDGGVGNDFLFGGKNDDVLAGGEGFDRLEGGRGSDIFVFADNGGTDRIFDYEGDRDVIHILDHLGDFEGLTIADQGADLSIGYDGGTILLVDQAGITLDETLFIFGDI